MKWPLPAAIAFVMLATCLTPLASPLDSPLPRHAQPNDGHRWDMHEDGWIREIATLRQGVRHGPYLSFFKGGILRQRAFYLNGQLHGEMVKYRRPRQIRMRASYLHGILHGAYVEYHENGQPKWTGWYQNGQRSGIWLLRDEAGTIREAKRYPWRRSSIPLH